MTSLRQATFTILCLTWAMAESNVDPVESVATSESPELNQTLFPPSIDDHRRSGTACGGHGVRVHNRCDCFYPYTEHGLSVGPRYDPTSAFFNKKCICDEDWSGDLCHIPIANQCNERGQYVNGRCLCHGFYFGPRCQYVGKCVQGKLTEGMCNCNYGYEGDYCDKIVCHHGYPDKVNNSGSCICPPRHSGQFCDECLLQGEHILPFPNCTEELVPLQAKLSRIRTNQLIFKRILIIFLAFSLLSVIILVMYILNWGHRRSAKLDSADLRTDLQEIVNERQVLLKQMFSDSQRNDKGGPYLDPNRLDHEFL